MLILRKIAWDTVLVVGLWEKKTQQENLMARHPQTHNHSDALSVGMEDGVDVDTEKNCLGCCSDHGFQGKKIQSESWLARQPHHRPYTHSDALSVGIEEGMDLWHKG